MNPRRILLAFSVLLPSFAATARAADWGIYGATICAAPGDRSTATAWTLAAPDGAGGAYMGWSDDRSGTPRLFLQRVTSGGGPYVGWDFHGVPVTPSIAIRQISPALAADPDGGVFMVWLEGEDNWLDPYHVVRVTRIEGDGSTHASWPAPGVVLTTSAFSNSIPAVVPDASGGAYVMWTGSTSWPQGLAFLHHVLGDGSIDPNWPTGGLIVGQSAEPVNAAIASDGQGGVLLAWDESLSPETGIVYRAQRILVTGAPAWDPDGVVIQTTTTPNNSFRAPGIVADGMGGAVVSFREFKNGEEHYGLYARRVLSNGQFAAGWSTAGTSVATTPPAVRRSVIVSDGAGGAILVWEAVENRPTYPWRIWAQRLDSNGAVAPGWPADGRRVSAPDRGASEPVALADGAGGVFVSWSSLREEATSRLCVHHIEADGTEAPGWGTHGTELAPGSPPDHGQGSPSLARSGADGVYAFWREFLFANGKANVVGQRFDPAPPTGVNPPNGPRSKVLSVYPNPAFAAVQVELSAAARVSVTVHDLAGRRVRSLNQQFVTFPGVPTSWTWDLRDDDGRRVAPGIYRIAVRGEAGVDSAPVVVLR